MNQSLRTQKPPALSTSNVHDPDHGNTDEALGLGNDDTEYSEALEVRIFKVTPCLVLLSDENNQLASY